MTKTQLVPGQRVRVRVSRTACWRPAIIRRVHHNGHVSVSFTDCEGVTVQGVIRARTFKPTPNNIEMEEA